MPAPRAAENSQKQHPLALSASVLLLCVGATSSGCGPSQRGTDEGANAGAGKDGIVLVAAERASRGGRLVKVSADGARQSSVTTLPAGTLTLDRSPVFTPDGKHIVFVSNRGRESLIETSLWVISEQGGEARRLTNSAAVDRDPRVSGDGKWLYFCSNRNGSFDLYRAPLGASAGSLGAVERITELSEQVLSPSLSPDGSELSYMAVNEAGESSIWRSRVDGQGAAQRLTAGPMDMTPAWGPDNTIAFASKAPGRDDADLFVMKVDGSQRRLLVAAPSTDETGPRWSNLGRYLFAIGTYRSARDGKPILGSVIYVDMHEKKPKLRALHDPAAVESRIGLALVPSPLSPKLLSRNADYADALQKVLLQSAVRNEKARSKQP